MEQLELFTGEVCQCQETYKGWYVPILSTERDVTHFFSNIPIVDLARALLGPEVKKGKYSKNYRGLCPFHTEKTPSFTIYPGSNSFHCYGCHASGGPVALLDLADTSFFRYLLSRTRPELSDYLLAQVAGHDNFRP